MINTTNELCDVSNIPDSEVAVRDVFGIDSDLMIEVMFMPYMAQS